METQTNQSKTSEIKYDKEIQIAIANSRNAKKWKNITLKISEFTTKLSKTARTPENQTQFLKMPKDDQDSIKDVGAFVGGVLKNGSRKKEDVANRHIITLDIDYAEKNTISTIEKELKDYCYTIYSTHKHTPDAPRLRLIVYTDRPMLSDEYQAVSRKVAFKINIDTVDDSSYDINRLFFWPSTSQDAEYIHKHNDASFMVVDHVLTSYGGDQLWKDAAMWPTSSRENAQVNRLLKKQADPLRKGGIVGAWCRTYSIREAIETYLSDVYRKEVTGRYSYIEGSTSNGVVIYEDKFAYSNHSTDPAHGQTCNAWDIVRIHKFGHLDFDIDSQKTFGRMLPSFKEMSDFAEKIPAVKSDFIKNNIKIDVEDFNDFGIDEDGNSWINRLQTTVSGKKQIIKNNWHNINLILENDHNLKNRFRKNFFTEREEQQDGELWTDNDSSMIKKYLGEKYEIDPTSEKLEKIINHRAHENGYHPVREYLESLEWDGKQRIETLWIDYIGAEDTPYTRQTAMCFFSAAVHRIFNPGHKFDYVVVLGGKQGVMKSTFVQVLGKRKWFGNLTSFDSKTAMEEILGKWIVELDELSATSKQEIEQQKSFLSAPKTTVRLAYDRRPRDFWRQCVFIGTTNNAEYLKDSTGNRRWWPIDVKVEKIDIEKLESEIDQIWAEAYQSLYISGYRTYLTDEVEELAKIEQDSKRFRDPWEGIITEWLTRSADADRYDLDRFGNCGKEPRDKTCIVEIWEDCLAKKGIEAKRVDQLRISTIMDNTPGWIKNRQYFGDRFGQQRCWTREIDPYLMF